jgi:hypothetical protein
LKCFSISSIKTNLAASQIVETVLNGIPHVKVPAIILQPGVHNGSSGPLLYSQGEIAASANLWNNVPVTIGHPIFGGLPISVKESPSSIIGVVRNARMDGSKLRCDLFLNKSAIQEKDPAFISNLKGGKQVDVSTGLISKDTPSSGVWNGEDYTAVVHGIEPDHLAILPNQRGACSFQDGCGIRANSNSSNTYTEISNLITEGMKKEKVMSNTTINEAPMELPEYNFSQTQNQNVTDNKPKSNECGCNDEVLSVPEYNFSQNSEAPAPKCNTCTCKDDEDLSMPTYNFSNKK